MLSAICYSEPSTELVIRGMRLLARTSNQTPLLCLSDAIVHQDIEVKTAVLRFVNSLILGADSDSHSLLRTDLVNVGFDEKCETALAQVEGELQFVEPTTDYSPPNSPLTKAINSTANAMSNRHKSISPKKVVNVDKMKADQRKLVALQGIRSQSMRGDRQSITEVMNASVNNMSMYGSMHSVNSSGSGSMPGSLSGTQHKHSQRADLATSKAQSTRQQGKLVTPLVMPAGCFGGASVLPETRWYSIFDDTGPNGQGGGQGLVFRRHDGDSVSAHPVPFIQIQAITDIRNSTSHDAGLLELANKMKLSVFEIATVHGECFAFGCLSPEDRDHWINALQTARSVVVISKSTYFMQQTFLELKIALRMAEQFKKLYTEYCSFVMEEKQFTVDTCGIDLNDVRQVVDFLIKEVTAAGTSAKLLVVLQELLLIPTDSEPLWDAIAVGIKNVRRISRRGGLANVALYDQLESAFPERTIRDLLQHKAESEGSGYKQMSKLAMAVMNSEKEVAALKQRIAELTGEPEGGTHANRTSADGHTHNNRQSVVRGRESLGSDHPEIVKLRGAMKDIQTLLDKVTKERDELLLQIKSASASTSATPVSASTGSTGELPEKFQKYVKMQKMLPEGAVRQKMAMEGISDQEIDDFFSGKLASGGASTSAAPVSASTAPALPEKFEKYVKMKKMLPEGAVRQKMSMEGIPDSEIDAFFAGTLGTTPTGPTPAPASTAPAAEDPRFEKFRKMQKMLPEGAVRQKMSLEGLTPAEIDVFFGVTPPASAAPAASASPPAIVLDPAKFEKFEKMKKMLPEGAVRQKMAMEGITPAEIDVFFGVTPSASTASAKGPGALVLPGAAGGVVKKNPFGPGASTTPAINPATLAILAQMQLVEPTVKMKNIFWNKIPDKDIPQTFWGKIASGQLETSSASQRPISMNPLSALSRAISQSKVDNCTCKDGTTPTGWVILTAQHRKELEEWFAAKPTNAVKPAAKVDKGDSSPKLIAVLDGKRTQNVLIVLGKLRRDAEEVLQMIITLDPAVLTHEITLSLLSILPNQEEITAIKQYTWAADRDRLDSASRLFLSLCRVPRLSVRMECHELAFSWFGFADDVANSLTVMGKAVEELEVSEGRLFRLCALVLAVGNYLNGGTKFGNAIAIKFDTLAKVPTMKAADAATQGSLMNYLALYAQRYEPALLGFSDHWVALWAAADMTFKQVIADLGQLESQVKKLEGELKRIQDNERKSGGGDSESGKDGGPQQLGLDDTKEYLAVSQGGQITKPLYDRLDGFLAVAKPRLAVLQENAKTIESHLDKAMMTLGESYRTISDDDPAKKFFGMLVTFARNFSSAHEQNVRRQKAAEKAARLAAEAQAKLESKKNKAAGLPPVPATPRRDSADKTVDASGVREISTVNKAPAQAEENIFGKFHSLDLEPSENIVEKFRQKLQKR